LAIVFAASLAATSPASTYCASPTGGGDGRSESSPFQIADFWQQAKPGDALLLLDGRYTGDRSMVRPPQGLKGAPKQPITVRALHDGRVEIDGENRRKTVHLYHNDYFVLEGYNVHGAGGGRDNATAVELSQDNLVQDCVLETTFVHNLSVNSFANGNVYSRITTRSARFDHHGGAPYENLFTQIVVTERAGDLFMCGGNRADEANSGARSTLWTIRAPKGRFPENRKPDKFPRINVIGVDRWPTQKTAADAWIERWPGETTVPPNLYESQKTQRLSKTATTPKEGEKKP
jgi:hypothetical protein